MQAVILAAGKSTRTYPLTLTKPKPLLKVANKALIEHNLENLKGFVSEVIIVVGYKGDLIKKYLGNEYKNLKLKYVEQKKQLGTAHAVSVAKPYIKNRFILLMGDDIYSKEDIKNCIKHRYSILTIRARNFQNFGVVIEKNNMLVDFVEKPKKFVSDLVSTALYTLDKRMFEYIEKIKKSERNEFELPDAIKLLSKEEKIYVVKSRRWFPVVHALDLLKADKVLRKKKTLIGKNSKINGLIKNSSIGNDCIIEGKIINSIIMDKTIIDKSSVVEDSVIGENVYLSGKIKKGIIADNVKAENVIINPGCKIWPNKSITGLIDRDVQ